MSCYHKYHTQYASTVHSYILHDQSQESQSFTSSAQDEIIPYARA